MESSYLIHSAKGTSWQKKDHKYIAKKNGRYIYNKTAQDARMEAEQKRADERENAYVKSGALNRTLQQLEAEISDGKWLLNRLGNFKVAADGSPYMDISDKNIYNDKGEQILTVNYGSRQNLNEVRSNLKKNKDTYERQKEMLEKYKERRRTRGEVETRRRGRNT